MRDLFDTELERHRELLVTMTQKVEAAIQHASNALLNGDRILAEQVIDADVELDALQREVDALGLEILARQQPVATDLRVVVTALRMGTTLERMGDLAVHIAKLARRRHPDRCVPPKLEPVFQEMAAVTARLAADVGQVIAERDLAMATQVSSSDDRLDELHRLVFATMLSEQWQEATSTTIDMTLGSRFYERFGDHAVALAGRVVYLVTGQLEKAAASTLGHHEV